MAKILGSVAVHCINTHWEEELTLELSLGLPYKHAQLAAYEHLQHALALVRDFVAVMLPHNHMPWRSKLFVQLLLHHLRDSSASLRSYLKASC